MPNPSLGPQLLLVSPIVHKTSEQNIDSQEFNDTLIPVFCSCGQMDASQSNDRNPNPNPNPRGNNGNSITLSTPVWPTIDGPLGLTEDDSLSYARKFYQFGFALLPFLWAVNCFYFWPVLRHSASFPRIRHCKLSQSLSLHFDFRLFALKFRCWVTFFFFYLRWGLGKL